MDGPLVQQYKFLWKAFHLTLKYPNFKSTFNLLVPSNVTEKLESPEFGFITIKVVLAIFYQFPEKGQSITTWKRWFFFVHAQGIKTVHAGGGGVKDGKILST